MCANTVQVSHRFAVPQVVTYPRDSAYPFLNCTPYFHRSMFSFNYKWQKSKDSVSVKFINFRWKMLPTTCQRVYSEWGNVPTQFIHHQTKITLKISHRNCFFLPNQRALFPVADYTNSRINVMSPTQLAYFHLLLNFWPSTDSVNYLVFHKYDIF